MPIVGKARVTAVFEVAVKLAPQLEALLRGYVTPQFPCILIEVTTHAEPELQQTEARTGRIERTGGIGFGDEQEGRQRAATADEDGGVAGASGEGKPKPGGRDSAKGVDGAVLPKETGDVVSGAKAIPLTQGRVRK